MSERIEARGDIGQVIDGNFYEAPRLNNVVNLNLPEPQKEKKIITGKQRKYIYSLVKEWSAISGKSELEIYGIFMTDYGVRYFKDLPMKHYSEIKSKLEAWISEARPSSTPISNVRSTEISAPNDSTNANSPLRHCYLCEEKERSFTRLLRHSRYQWWLILTLALVCGTLLFRWPTSIGVSRAEGHCYFDGKPYSLGSKIKLEGGRDIECISTSSYGITTWSKAN